MYNSVTAAEIMRVPALKSLDVKRLPQKLTEAYARIVSARAATPGENDETALRQLLDEMFRLGHTYLAWVIITEDKVIQKSAAFVAGSAFELLAAHSTSFAAGTFTATSICSVCAAALLFMVADAPSDAAEVTRHLPDEDQSPERHLLHRSIRLLALGKLARAAEMPDSEFESGFEEEHQDQTERAVATLYSHCLYGIRALCSAMINGGSIDEAAEIFRKVKSLCIDDCSDLLEQCAPEGTPLLSTFPGPFLLASLLGIACQTLFEAALINIPSPNVRNVKRWRSEIKRLVRRKPYLWLNHKRIIEQHRCLDHGVSAVLGLPTGAGKTTIAQLKALATLVDNRKVVFLAPTHALARQVEKDWKEAFPHNRVATSFLFSGEYAEAESEILPDIAVMTPERCLSLLSIGHTAFGQVGLVIMDECHILHSSSLDTSYRAADAMFCLLRLFDQANRSDFLLMSAMIENVDDLAGWIAERTTRPCAAARDEWKPTRQVRGCVVYKNNEIRSLTQTLLRDRGEARRTGRKAPGSSVKRHLTAHPFGLFSLNQTWSSVDRSNYVVLPLLENPILLAANKFWGLTPNRNAVSADLSAKLADAHVKTIVFCQNTKDASAIAEQIAGATRSDNSIIWSQRERDLWKRLVEEFGDEKHLYGPIGGVAACHHGLLFPDEREIAEGLFARDSGIRVLVATPTLAQGMNLPAEAVVIAGDQRFNAAQNEQEELEAHELLNAAGRAGRADKKAQGFVFIVPGEIVEFDDTNNSLSSKWFALQKTVFSKSDQCLTVIDPLQRLVDSIHTATLQDDRPTQFILRRVPCPPGQSLMDSIQSIMRRSFTGYVARKHHAEEKFDRDVDELAEFAEAIIQPTDDLPWVMSLSTELGVSAETIIDIDRRLDSIAPNWQILDYVKWGFENRLIEKLLRPKTLEDMVTTLTTTAERKREESPAGLCMTRLEALLTQWMAGLPLNEIEGMVCSLNGRLGKCIGARKLALRWSADVAYSFGIVTRLYRRRVDDTATEMPTVLATLAACVRQGVDSPAKLAVVYAKHFEVTRVRAHRIFSDIRGQLANGFPYEPFRQTMRRIETAMRARGHL